MKFSDSINYRPYEYGRLVITLSAEEANALYKNAEQEFIEFFAEYGIPAGKAKEAAESVFRKHIVKF